MRILWVCNFMLPAIAKALGMGHTNKEGWVAGLASVIQERKKENGIQLAMAFPVQKEMDGCQGEVEVQGEKLYYYGFYEDTVHPEQYDAGLEKRLSEIFTAYDPEVIHCFGTEFPHTLAATKACPDKQKLLIGIQGLCSVYSEAFMANLPLKVINSVTFRDWLKRDSLIKQREKFEVRGMYEIEAICHAGNITGRTHWDRHYSKKWSPKAEYYHMNETLRPVFYTDQWDREKCVPHQIFLSQGDYPIKGLHYMLLALGKILKKYPDTKIRVAGNSIVKDETWKDKIKISAYGKYLQELLQEHGLKDKVMFLGSLTAEQMKAEYLAAELFVCCSSIENSPNSLGEAMILGVPCVAAEVGGINSLFRNEVDGILYQGFCARRPYDYQMESMFLEKISQNLADAVLKMWADPEKSVEYGLNARAHARATHDREANYHRMLEIYTSIAGKNK